MKGLAWLVLGVLAVASFDLLELAHGDGVPLQTGGALLPVSLGPFGMWVVAGGGAVLAIGRALDAWGLAGRLERVFEAHASKAVGLAAAVGGLVAAGLAWRVGATDLTADDSVRRTLAALLTDGAVSMPVLVDADAWVRPAVAIRGDAVVPTVSLGSAALTLPGTWLGMPAVLSVLAHALTVPAVARLVERVTTPGSGALAAWSWALLPGALLPAATALPHAPTLLLLAWAAVFARSRAPLAAGLVALALLLRPVGAAVPALVLATVHPVVAAGAGGGLVLAGLFAGLQTGWPVWHGVLEGWRLAALPVLAGIGVQVAAGWPFGLLPAAFAFGPDDPAERRSEGRRWLAMAVGILLLVGVAPSFGPDWLGPIRLHELLLPGVVLCWMGMVRLARAAGRPDWLFVGGVAVLLVTTGGWARHRAVSMVAAADTLRLPDPPRTPALVYATRPGRGGPCGKAPARASLPVPLTRRDAVVWLDDPGGRQRAAIAAELGVSRVFTLSWNRRRCRAELKPGAPR
jgi:hypothetical protein